MLGAVLVGHLEPDEATERVKFTFDPSYVARPDRPVLSRSFEELDLSWSRVFEGRSLPSFFRNLLPEGALRKVLEARMPRSRLLEYRMLLRLGEDLPGNLIVTTDELDVEETESSTPTAFEPSRPDSDPIRFALAGVQLKASIVARAERLTLPLVGASGDWIAKFPSAVLADLPENELTMLRWAHAAGLDVPEHRLAEVSAIENLPSDFPSTGKALLVRRFDRTTAGRIHQEDFSQVFGLEPEDRYLVDVPDYVHYGALGAIILALCGGEDLREYVRRLAFMVLSGNNDAHLKNWTLVYPDGLHARLSPLYDVVATIAYERLDRVLALGWLAPEDPNHTPHIPFEAVDYEYFRALARFVGHAEDEIERDVRAFVARARSAWDEIQDSSVPKRVREGVTEHLRRCRIR
jgi:serine/threonine-protein kinase HipA